MSFFQPPAPPEGVVYTPVAADSPPAWARPPGNVLPGVVPLEVIVVIVARTDQTVVAVSGMRAYPTGFSFTLHLRLRDLPPRQEQQFPSMWFAHVPEGEPLPDEFLRFGVQFADGRKAINFGPRPIADGGEPEAPVLEQFGVSGVGSSVWDAEQWVWPLPPPGPFWFVCEWPGRGIALSRVRIDARLILQAAEQAGPP